jgi:hypothetical protein
LDGGELVGLFSSLGGLAVMAIAVLSFCWALARRAEYRARQLELETNLKQDMLNRGMSAEEIERVLNAGHTKPARCWRGGWLARRA